MSDALIYAKPLPTITPLTRQFWEGARRGVLQFQHCEACGRAWYPIGPRCPKCLSDRYEWRAVSGRGSVLSFVVFHQVYNAAFKQDAPYNVALVELEEDLRMFSNIVGIDNDSIEVGMDVEVIFEKATEDVSIPRFRAVDGPAIR